MKTLELNQMENVQAADGCAAAKLAADLAFASGNNGLGTGILIGAFLAGC